MYVPVSSVFHVCMGVHGGQKGAGATGIPKLMGGWKPNSRSLQEQQEVLTAELSLYFNESILPEGI